ncbi:MAG: hypothetical protein L0H73_18815 [Nitrococcus sp.]|nr:hypothetical protein [Nitrococcus sp.]
MQLGDPGHAAHYGLFGLMRPTATDASGLVGKRQAFAGFYFYIFFTLPLGFGIAFLRAAFLHYV